jgi:murein L,D-transpeptidase YafK
MGVACMARAFSMVTLAGLVSLVGCFMSESPDPTLPIQAGPVGVGTGEPQEPPLMIPVKSPRIVILKSARKLELWSGDVRVRSFPVALGNEPELEKERQGDHRTPEGDFYVCTRNDRSRFHLFLGLSYPTKEDAERGLRERLISRAEFGAIVRANDKRVRPPWDTGLGGEVGIHGGGIGSDWTWGCIALENAAIEELWRACPLGTPVRIEK